MSDIINVTIEEENTIEAIIQEEPVCVQEMETGLPGPAVQWEYSADKVTWTTSTDGAMYMRQSGDNGLTWSGAIDFSPSVAALALKAPLKSPAFTDTPTAPTAAQGTNTTQLATCAHVFQAMMEGDWV